MHSPPPHVLTVLIRHLLGEHKYTGIWAPLSLQGTGWSHSVSTHPINVHPRAPTQAQEVEEGRRRVYTVHSSVFACAPTCKHTVTWTSNALQLTLPLSSAWRSHIKFWFSGSRERARFFASRITRTKGVQHLT